MSLSGELKVGTLDDGVDRAGLLTKAAIDAFGHVNVVAGSPENIFFSLFNDK